VLQIHFPIVPTLISDIRPKSGKEIIFKMQIGIKICVFMFWSLLKIQLPKYYLLKLFITMRIKYLVPSITTGSCSDN
jgi:hypothetical protein